ncbi:MAG: hypothetical protein KDD43_13310, partial [Bdellovibrionales bacterium]|nr:hypothetical protein [Bdellovibrionales bacterium]
MVRGFEASQPMFWGALWRGVLLGFLLILFLSGTLDIYGQESVDLSIEQTLLADKALEARLPQLEWIEPSDSQFEVRLRDGNLIQIRHNEAELTDCCGLYFPDESSRQRFLEKRRMILTN